MNVFFNKYVGLALFSSLLFSCSQTTLPLASSPEIYTQYKVQAVDHWDTLANNLAARVQKAFEDRQDLITRPVYIVPPADGIFTRAFMSLLRTRLVTRGMQVSEEYEPGSVELSFTVQTVPFDSSRGGGSFSLGGLGIGIGSAIVGGYTSTSDNEIVINTTMVHQNRYVLSLSQICYINDGDLALYFNADALRDKGASADREWKKYSRRGQSFESVAKPYEMPVDREYRKTVSVVSSSSYSTASSMSVPPVPIIEEYIMPAGGKMIDPSAPPTPIGRKKR